MKAEYIDHMGSDLTVVNAARVSFNKESSYEIDWDNLKEDTQGVYLGDKLKDEDVKLISYLARHNHWTPFSHPQVTLRMTAPVFIRTQCFKHKQGFTENEVSRRYVDDEPEFFIPDVWRGRPKNSKQGSSDEVVKILYSRFNGDQTVTEGVERLYEHSIDLYTRMIEIGVCPEQARMVLPQSMYTQWYWTGSLAAYARFYKQRTDPHAQKEVQDLAKIVGEVIEPLFPISWRVLTE